MRILFALAGFHRFDRGAEVALSNVAIALAKTGDDVTLIGSGMPRPDQPYRFIHAGSVRRERFERWPSLPGFRNETGYEEATFALALAAAYRPGDYDVTITCSYPYTNWVLRRPALGGRRPPHVFVTQNGDWPATATNAEYRFFGCEGLVCTNPDFFARNQAQRRSVLIPNGTDIERFSSGPGDRSVFELDGDGPVVLMVSALIATKRVDQGIRAVSRIPGARLVVAGDGPLRDEAAALAEQLMPGRYRRVSVPAAQMPTLYRSADAFLHLSEHEAFGNVYVEAMACGRPVVAHDTPRTRWILGDDQFLIDSTDLDALTASISAALASAGSVKHDRSRVERFSLPTVAEHYRDFLRELVGRV